MAEAYALETHARQPPPTTTPPTHNATFNTPASTPVSSVALHAHPDRVGGRSPHIPESDRRKTSEPNLFPESFLGNYSLVCQYIRSLFFLRSSVFS